MAIIASVVILVMWIVVASSIVRARHVAAANARSEARNLSIAFADEVDHNLDRVNREMQLVADRVRASNGHFDLTTVAQEVAVLGPTQATLIGPDGKLRSTTLAPEAPPIDLSDRPQFRVHLDAKFKGIFVGQAVVARLNQQYLIPVSQRIEADDGRFLGVLVFLIPPGSLTDLNKSMDLRAHDVIVLTGLDDVIRARFASDSPDGTVGIGQSIAGGPRPSDFPERGEGFYVRPGIVDGLPRIYSYRRVGAYPLVVSVGLDMGPVLAVPNSDALRMLVMAAGATVLLAGLVTYLIREMGVVARHEKALSEERKRLEDNNVELVASRERADAVSQAKSLFLANMSHELRTPLNAIIGFSEVIRDELFGPVGKPCYSEYARDIVASGNHLLGVINDILDLAKIDAGKMTLDESDVCLGDVLDIALTTVRGAAAHKQLGFQVLVPDELPCIRADGRKLAQILINLLSNAVKFTPEGGQVRFSVEQSGDGGIVLAVSDTGIGMSAAEVEESLESFVQVENSMTKTQAGTGLGLPLAKKFAEMHGASFEIDSAPGKGTTVRLCLPSDRVLRTTKAFASAG